MGPKQTKSFKSTSTGNHKSSSSMKVTSHLQETIQCPFCNTIFDKAYTFKQVNAHLKSCGFECFSTDEVCDLYTGNNDNTEPNENFLYLRIQNYVTNKSKFFTIPPSNKANAFENKVVELKSEISQRKISWQEGCCQLNLTRQNFLYQSMEQIEQINIFKELKINFKGEVSYDAGGLLREWFTIVFESLLNKNRQLFLGNERDDSDYSFSINPLLLETKSNFKYFNFIGKLLGKALLDNITINLCFNKVIYKLIVEEEVQFNDLIFIDKSLYHSLSNLKSMSNDRNFDIESLALFYVIDMNIPGKTNQISVDLKKNGRNEQVTKIEDYIQSRIDFILGSIAVFTNEIKKGMFSILPKEIITIFTADELELLLNGRPFIDVDEWKEYTNYKPPIYPTHPLIENFWEILQNLSQKKLSNFLQFCTGSSRVPIGGFSELESNRGEISRFTIEMVPYKQNQKNFIKAHTCFNRIEVPSFPTKELLQEAIEFVCQCEIFGFGID